MFKKSLLYAALFAAVLPLASCSENDEPDNNEPSTNKPVVSEGAYILNQGSYYNNVEGMLSYIDFKSSSVSNNVFTSANNRSLGDTPQCGVKYGSKIYIGVWASNTIEILDAATFVSEKQIKLDQNTGNEPRAIIPYKGKVYVSMFDGYIASLDTTSLQIDRKVKVGPNPEIPVIHKGKMYVPNSDGNNWAISYGTTASIIDIDSFTVTATVNVPLNPKKFMSDGEHLFLLSLGNNNPENSIDGALYEIDPDIDTIQKKKDDKTGYTKLVNATLAACGNGSIYLIDAPYYKEGISYYRYDIKSGNTVEWKPEGVAYPNEVAVDSDSGNVIVTSYIMNGQYPSYIAPGYALLYDSKNTLLGKFNVGAGPAAIFFNNK